MKKNMNKADAWIRFMIVLAIGVLYFTNVISGTLAIVLGALALIFLITSIISWCPLYRLFGISTCKTEKAKS